MLSSTSHLVFRIGDTELFTILIRPVLAMILCSHSNKEFQRGVISCVAGWHQKCHCLELVFIIYQFESLQNFYFEMLTFNENITYLEISHINIIPTAQFFSLSR